MVAESFVKITGTECGGLITDLSCSDVREERADGVALRVMQVVER